MFFTNGVILCWNSANTMNTTIVFPITFTEPPTIIGVGFVIEGVGRQAVGKVTISQFSTGSDMRRSATDSYLAIGI